MKKFNLLGALLLSTLLGACSQGRESLLAGDKSKWWGPQSLCQNGSASSGANCFEVAINLSYNEVYMYVERVEPAALEMGYRVAVRFQGDDSLEVIGTGLNYRAGEEFTLSVGSGRDVTLIEEWLVETEQNVSSNGLNFVQAAVGYGIPMANAIIDWEELFTDLQ